MSGIMDHKDEQYDIIVQGGQSNAQGYGFGPVEGSNEYAPDDDILYMVNSSFDSIIDIASPADNLLIEVAKERYWDGTVINDCEGEKVNEFSLSFAKLYQRKFLSDGRKILILRTAVGGTGWKDNRWGMTDDLYLNMMRMVRTALELNPGNMLKAFLWHQGETDAGTAREIHYNNLSSMVKSVRDTFGCPGLPFIAGDFVNEWKSKNLDVCEPVIDAIRGVCSGPGGAFVETQDLKSNNQVRGDGDEIHFSRNSLYILGCRYFEAYVSLMV